MKDVLLALPGIALTVCCWGAYGSVLHKGQDRFKTVQLDQGINAKDIDAVGLRLKPLICVGIAYFIVAIIVPTAILIMRGSLGGGWSFGSTGWSLTAGCAGALGALGIILALSAGGKPIYVMPLVFGCAPVVNVFVSMYFSGIPLRNVSPIFIAGMILVSVGAVVVLVFQPRASTPSHASAKAAPSAAASSKSPDGDSTGSPATENASAGADEKST